jgi:hypothetical protein
VFNKNEKKILTLIKRKMLLIPDLQAELASYLTIDEILYPYVEQEFEANSRTIFTSLAKSHLDISRKEFAELLQETLLTPKELFILEYSLTGKYTYGSERHFNINYINEIELKNVSTIVKLYYLQSIHYTQRDFFWMKIIELGDDLDLFDPYFDEKFEFVDE